MRDHPLPFQPVTSHPSKKSESVAAPFTKLNSDQGWWWGGWGVRQLIVSLVTCVAYGGGDIFKGGLSPNFGVAIMV